MSRTPKKTPESKRDAPEADTISYEQPQGAANSHEAPRRAERLPHERDESARATGDRLKERPTPSDRRISRAGDDVERGVVDTDFGIPNNIPTSKPRKE